MPRGGRAIFSFRERLSRRIENAKMISETQRAGRSVGRSVNYGCASSAITLP